MAIKYVEVVNGTSDAKYPADRTNANAAGIYVDSGDSYQLKYNANGTVLTLQDTTTTQNALSKAGDTIVMQAAFVENATTLTHTATFNIPIGALLQDIWFLNTVLWTGAGTVALTIGDANSANGWFTSTNLKATDLLVGERLQASNANNWGGVNGAYLTTAGRFGQQSTTNIGGYALTAFTVIMVVTESSPSTTAGRSFGYVSYSLGYPVTPVKV